MKRKPSLFDLSLPVLALLVIFRPNPVYPRDSESTSQAPSNRDTGITHSSMSELERRVLELLTPEQIQAYLDGVAPSEIQLPDGNSLEDLLETWISSQAGTFEISWYTVDGGGVTFSGGGDFEVGGTVGQPDVGNSTNGDLEVVGGFWALFGSGPVLSIPPDLQTAFGRPLAIPISLQSFGAEISATSFSLDFDEACLVFDDTDGDLDGVPDNITFSLPSDFVGSVSYDETDTDGELDLVILDFLTPLASLPDGPIVTITLESSCEPTSETLFADLLFSDDPSASFGDINGRSIPGTTVDGEVEILVGSPGDCNGDDLIDAGDLSALVLEIFDGDGDFWLDTRGGSFSGSPVGCDSNEDHRVDAGDISCAILRIFTGAEACSSQPLQKGSGKPELTIPRKIPQSSTRGGNHVRLPVYFDNGGWAVNALAFSIDFDEDVFELDPADHDGNGIPDAVDFDLPPGVRISVGFDPEDHDGELDFVLFDPGQPIVSGSAEPIVAIRLRYVERPDRGVTRLGFSSEPSASFGDLVGIRIDGSTRDGFVELDP